VQILLIALALAWPTGGASTTCTPIAAGGATYSVRIFGAGLGCAPARTALRGFIVTGSPPRGWACFRGHGDIPWAAACARRSGGPVARAYLRRERVTEAQTGDPGRRVLCYRDGHGRQRVVP